MGCGISSGSNRIRPTRLRKQFSPDFRDYEAYYMPETGRRRVKKRKDRTEIVLPEGVEDNSFQRFLMKKRIRDRKIKSRMPKSGRCVAKGVERSERLRIRKKGELEVLSDEEEGFADSTALLRFLREKLPCEAGEGCREEEVELEDGSSWLGGRRRRRRFDKTALNVGFPIFLF